MKNCSLYLPNNKRRDLLKLIQDVFKNATITPNTDSNNWTQIKIKKKKGWFRKCEATLNFLSFDHPEQFVPMLEGMMNFIAQISTPHTLSQSKLMTKVQQTNSALAIVSEDLDLFEKELFKIVAQYNGFAFVDGTSWLTHSKEVILDIHGNSQNPHLDITKEEIRLGFAEQNNAVEITANQKNRKRRNIDFLNNLGVPTIEHLPCIIDEEKVAIRSINAIVKRIIAIAITAVKAEGLEMERINQIISQFDAAHYFSPEEIDFLNNPTPSQQDLAKFSWRYEGLWVLLWSLDFIKILELPTDICNVGKAVTIIRDADTTDTLIKQANLKSKGQILDQTDLIYRLNWACVESNLKGEDVPANINPGIVYERHYAFNWLISNNNEAWDDVNTNT